TGQIVSHHITCFPQIGCDLCEANRRCVLPRLFAGDSPPQSLQAIGGQPVPQGHPGERLPEKWQFYVPPRPSEQNREKSPHVANFLIVYKTAEQRLHLRVLPRPNS